MARHVPPGVEYAAGLRTVTFSGQPCDSCLDRLDCQTEETARRLIDSRQCPRGPLLAENWSATVEQEPIRLDHMGYVHHDFMRTERIELPDDECFSIVACDIPEPVNNCLFEVKVLREIADEEYPYRYTEEEAIHCPTQEQAETVFAAMVEKYRATAEKERTE